VFFEKSGCCFPPPPPEGCDMIDREFSFWFLLVVTELFAFCADDVAKSKEVTNRIENTSNSKNANRGKVIDVRIVVFLS
jgi:hypothetical protein